MPEQTLVTLTLENTRTGVIAWSASFEEPTNLDNYIHTQKALASRMAQAFTDATKALD